MSKIKKALKTPHLFLRDYLIKRYPIKYSELKFSAEEVFYTQKVFRDIDIIDNELSIGEPVDIVYTWVDNTDPAWQLKFNKYSNLNMAEVSPGAKNPARFENHNELYYSVRSVLDNLTWVNKIYIVTDNEIPAWLKCIDSQFRDEILIVDHEQIIDKKYLPTFNSHVIESNLFKINGLNENFIYFNDDVFVGHKLNKSHFFKSDGIASIFISNKKQEDINKKRETATTFACRNSTNLLKIKYGIIPNYSIQHTYIPLKKSFFSFANDLFRDKIEEFYVNKFRSKNDINVATYLIPWMMYFEGKAQLSRDICNYFNCRSSDGKAQMEFLLKNRASGYMPDSICANDFIKKEETDLTFYKDFLEKYFKG